MAVSWQAQEFCRVYSLHKGCEFSDILHEGSVVDSFAFDQYGQYLMTCAGNKLRMFYYRDFTVPFAVLDSKAQIAMFDVDCNKIVVAQGQKVQFMSRLI
jgi:hypothetical protein